MHDGEVSSSKASAGDELDIMASGLPEDVKQFLQEHISSVAQLEVLLMLRKNGDRQWTPDAVSRELYTTSEMVAQQLADLCKRGLLEVADGPEPRYRYSPADPGLDAQVGTLDTAYRERRVAVITFIYSQPVEKVRTFADAFRLRKER